MSHSHPHSPVPPPPPTQVDIVSPSSTLPSTLPSTHPSPQLSHCFPPTSLSSLPNDWASAAAAADAAVMLGYEWPGISPTSFHPPPPPPSSSASINEPDPSSDVWYTAATMGLPYAGNPFYPSPGNAVPPPITPISMNRTSSERNHSTTSRIHPYAKSPTRFVPPPLPPPTAAIAAAAAAIAAKEDNTSHVTSPLSVGELPALDPSPPNVSIPQPGMPPGMFPGHPYGAPNFAGYPGYGMSYSGYPLMHPMSNPYAAMAAAAAAAAYGHTGQPNSAPVMMPPVPMMDFAGFLVAAAAAATSTNANESTAESRRNTRRNNRNKNKAVSNQSAVNLAAAVASAASVSNNPPPIVEDIIGDNEDDDTGDMRHYVIFNRVTYELIVRSLRVDMGLPEFMEGTESNSPSRHIELKDAHTVANVARKKWIRLKGRMTYLPNEHPNRCITWKDCHLIIAPQEEWSDIVMEFHTAINIENSRPNSIGGHPTHNSLKQTYLTLKKVYQTRRSRCGIPYETIAAIMATCPDCQNMRFINSPARLRGSLPPNMLPLSI